MFSILWFRYCAIAHKDFEISFFLQWWFLPRWFSVASAICSVEKRVVKAILFNLTTYGISKTYLFDYLCTYISGKNMCEIVCKQFYCNNKILTVVGGAKGCFDNHIVNYYSFYFCVASQPLEKPTIQCGGFSCHYFYMLISI